VNGARRQRGIALLIALLTVALAAVLIAGLLDRGELALARTRNALRGEQAQAYAQGLEAYAARVLLKDSEDSGDYSTDIWAMPLAPQVVPGGIVRGSMRDLNGCFNLNNLASQTSSPAIWENIFRRLLDVRGVDESVLVAVQDWLGASHDVDTADAYYLAQPAPYRSAQRVFSHVSELRLVRGVTSEVYARLAPYVCALPKDSPINVNTASVPVLQSLGPDISTAQAEALWQNGQAHYEGGFQQDWTSRNVVLFPGVGAREIGIASSYFLARSDIDLDGIPFTFFSVIQRGGTCHLCVVERSRGSDMAPAVWGAAAAPAAASH
jgi:general secretion pathway protein K